MKTPHTKIFVVAVVLSGILLTCGTVYAHRPCCAGHGGVSGCACGDGTALSATCAPYYPECSQKLSKSHSSRRSSVQASQAKKIPTAKCVISNGLPDPTCTPGAAIPTATKDIICKVGYSKSVRDVSTATKNKGFAEYGVTKHSAATYEVGHFISLELGGSNDITNLWPEAASPKLGFHEKDKVETFLHSQLCSGNMTLEEVQKDVSINWLSIYNFVFSNASY